MSQATNWYRADLRDFRFVMFEQFRLGDLLGKAPFEEWGQDEVVATLEEVFRFATEVLGPLNAVGDRTGVRVVDGEAVTPPGFREAWQRLYEAGFRQLGTPRSMGGMEAPHSLTALANELTSGANTAFDMYPGLTVGAADLIEAFGSPRQKELYARRMFEGRWAGTMCLTEPQAGSDVGAATTSATPNGDGTYSIVGTKIFISGGDHDLTENIVHMVLARTPGSPAGTKGLSLFIVPKHRVADDGTLQGSNDVVLAALEHKLGINGSATAMLKFGENGTCRGELVGGEERHGMRQMFQMMNYARIGVGLQGLGIMSSAYLCALDFARQRKQGSSLADWKDPEAPRVPILQHPHVRRMLLEMKAKVEGTRALVTKLTTHLDRARQIGGQDDARRLYEMGQVELLTPLVKAWSSDQAFRVAELAVQVMGGVGYTRDFPVEQYLRDSKIFSIYEGTNGIQALDLVGRKLGQRGGQNAQDYFADVARFVAAQREHAVLGPAVARLGAALDALQRCALQFMAWFGGGELVKVPLAADRFLGMFSEVTVGWLLLDQARIALDRLAELPADHPDRAFYEGKRHAALYFATNVLPGVVSGAESILAGDASPMDIPEASFATV